MPDLSAILAAHRRWRDGEPDGVRADLRGADLRGADLADADLTDAVLAGAVLAGAYLVNADLTDAVLAGVDLADADLRGADLRGADLTGADLRGAVLTDITLPDGGDLVGWCRDVAVPLLAAGGRDLAEILTPEHWACHDWANCPLRAAHGVANVRELPRVWRAHGALFLTLFDARQLPLDVLRAAAGLPALDTQTTTEPTDA